MTYASAGKGGKVYHIASYDIVCRGSIPTTCHVCGEMVYEESTDDTCAYDIVTFACRNGHTRTVFIEKEV